MVRMLVTHSDSHPRPMEVVREEFSDFEVGELEVDAGGLRKHVEGPLVESLEGCEVLLLRPGVVDRAVIERAPDLKVIALTGSGYDNVDVEAATEHGIAVVHTPENPGPSVVEHTIGISISLLRDFPEKFQLLREGDWTGARETVTGLGESTLGVVGLGTIGFGVARIASEAFGSDVIGYDPYVTGRKTSPVYPRHDQNAVETIGVELEDDLTELCRRADVVSLHVPLTSHTKGLIGTAELEALSDGVLVNTSRGGVVDEAALVESIRAGTFTGKAALDVLEDEPPAPDDLLLQFDTVYVTPHVAGVTNRSQEEAIGRTAEKIRMALDGERPDTAVNPEVFD